MVRCAGCKYVWPAELPDLPGAETAPVKTAVEINPSIIPLTLPPTLPKASKPLWQNDWVGAGAALIVACLFLWLAIDRRDIAESWPFMEGFYDRVGLHIFHAGEGLALVNVRSEMKFDSGTTQLTIEGEIHNKTDKPQSVPNILAAAIGPDGKVMQSWQIDAPAATLEPDQSVPFSSEIMAPQGTVVNINLHFIETNNAS